MTLEVTGDSIQTTIGGGTADIVFVIDKSSSMNQWDYDLGGNRWTILKETVDRFINKLKTTSPNSKISFIEYQSSDLDLYRRTGTYDDIRNVAKMCIRDSCYIMPDIWRFSTNMEKPGLPV